MTGGGRDDFQHGIWNSQSSDVSRNRRVYGGLDLFIFLI
jgi:hypothetical protein